MSKANFEIKRTVHKDAIPQGHTASKYDPLVKAAKTLDKNEALEVRMDKPNQIYSIRKNLEKKTPSGMRFKVVKRKKLGEHYCYIYRKS